MDNDGYPDDNELQRIREWPKDWAALLEYVHSLWWMPSWGWSQDGNTYKFSTGGWSGNEDLIAALEGNWAFWMICWVQSRRGGHYIFTVEE